MFVRRVVVSVLLLVAIATAGDKPPAWIEISSPHFVVVCDAGEKQARSIAGQLERMRAVFLKMFPRSGVSSPVTVLAVKNDKEFRSIEPEAYLAKGQMKPAGYFLHADDENLIVMRLDAGGDHPYSVIYHEYTHFLARNAEEWLPRWLDEGIAEFYETTEIGDKEVTIGKPNPALVYLLREQRLVPLPTIFAVDASSPYYHEENKASIFYAEAWALTHYLRIKDLQEHGTRLQTYLQLTQQKVDPVTAATQAFGDLTALMKTLDKYVAQSNFTYLKLPEAVTIKESEFKARPLPASEGDALRARVLAYNRRPPEARALLQAVLHDDPQNVSAHETMGYLEFRDNHLAEARKWFEEAIQLNSHSYRAHFYFATIAMSSGNLDADAAKRVESGLRMAIQLNPSFAPAYDRLAVFFGMRHENLEEAYRMESMAVQLEPQEINYRMNAVNILMELNRTDDAIRVIENASKIAKSPEDLARIENSRNMVESYVSARNAATSRVRDPQLPPAAPPPAADESSAPVLKHAADTAGSGRAQSATGTITHVRCSVPAVLDFTLETQGNTVSLHSDNYYKIQFSAIGFVPTEELKPCTQLEGKRAQVGYLESSGSAPAARVTSVQLQK